ncbi:EAL domain-containing response regulator [Achromobacter sp. DH1f]|uniref:EAL domain-containing response regulator n=1 Tax=Achromobacter sp. DH1f TaxID=1397275 RepID=UPI000468567D|nr:EAL domain-containing response regulator [Achromobacter sp. DH1f]
MKPFSLLIVDDHAWQLEYLSRLFQRGGEFRVETASRGEDALELMKSVKFDLILLDLMMPEFDGIQFIRQLAQQPVKPGLAIMSASSSRLLNSASRMAELLGIRVVGHLEKPVRLADVKSLASEIEVAWRSKYHHRDFPLALERDTLQAALEGGKVQTWFQPKVSLGSGAVVGAEALARWITDDGLILLPNQFLPALSLFQLDETLLQCVIKQTITAQRKWDERGVPVPVSINLPPHLFDDESLPDKILNWTLAEGGQPATISFELTEESTARSQSNFFAGACRLRMMGFGLAQDDFSQGYSSLYNLISAPFSELKIDRALVVGCLDDDGAQAAVESAVALGQRLGIMVVAEGVQQREQVEYLRSIGCDAAQGFYFSGALSADLFAGYSSR